MKNDNLFKFVVIIVLVAIILGSRSYSVSAVDTSQMERVEFTGKHNELTRYAVSFVLNPNIPYIYGTDPGGEGRRYPSLEAVEEANKNGSKLGVDCSGYTSLVYKKFGINITAQSEEQKKQAKKVIDNESEAMPGDIVWWYGHVAIYLGDGKIVHTHTSRAGHNLIHLDSISGDSPTFTKEGGYKFLRMVDDTSILGALSDSDSDSVNDTLGSIGLGEALFVSVNDLTGMEEEYTFTGTVTLPSADKLTDTEINNLTYIKDAIDGDKMSINDVARACVSFSGLLVILYGVALYVAYLYDSANTFLDISLLSIVSFGRLRVWSADYGVEKGMSRDGYYYCDGSLIITRCLVIIGIGLIIISGSIYRLLYWVVTLIVDTLF